MSTKNENNLGDQEIDLMAISKSFKNGINKTVFNTMNFIIQHKIVIGILFLVGIGTGLFIDSEQKSYINQVIVQPNFKSVDYLYSKIELIDSKIKEGDTVFLKSIGIQDTQKFMKIEIEPVVDIYEFVNPDKFINPETDKKFDLLKLMAEGGNLNKIVEEKATSKNYRFHLITFRTKNKTTSKKTLEPLLHYLNSDPFFKKCQVEYVNNVKVKMKANDVIIAQIDAVLNSFSNKLNSNAANDKLVYFNENTQLNDLIYNKDRLLLEQAKSRLDLVSFDKIIKDNSVVLNKLNKESLNGKMKYIIPMMLIFIYLALYQTIRFYKTQLAKTKEQE